MFLTISELADLLVLLLELLAHLVHGHAPRERLRHLGQDARRSVLRAAQVVAEPVLLQLEALAVLLEAELDRLLVRLLGLLQGLLELGEHGDADLAVALLERGGRGGQGGHGRDQDHGELAHGALAGNEG